MGRTEVKICGITQPADAALCARLGVDYVGLNFYPKSPRCITVERAIEIMSVAPELNYVGVVVRPSADELCELRDALPLHSIQVHDPAGVVAGAGQLGLTFECDLPPLVLAGGVAQVSDWTELCFLKTVFEGAGAIVGRLLVDAKVAGSHGGTGQTAPWRLLAGALRPETMHSKKAPPPDPPAIFLAGGLTPENVVEAIGIVRPRAVDVASGVESVPGVKDPKKLEAFVAAVREA